jgi:hypothetical protein
MVQLSPSDADRYWYASRAVGVVGVVYSPLTVVAVRPVPSSSVDFLFGVLLRALVPTIERVSDSTPLCEETDLGDG